VWVKRERIATLREFPAEKPTPCQSHIWKRKEKSSSLSGTTGKKPSNSKGEKEKDEVLSSCANIKGGKRTSFQRKRERTASAGCSNGRKKRRSGRTSGFGENPLEKQGGSKRLSDAGFEVTTSFRLYAE